MLTKPRALPEYAHIAVLAASGASDRARIETAARRIERRGHRVTIADNVDHRHWNYLAGDDDERARIFNDFLRSPEYDAYFFARGGYGAMRILDRIDYAAMRDNPRPLVGFSDVTAIHQALARHAGVASFHGPMLNLDFHDALSQENEEWLWSILRGEAPLTYHFRPSNVICEGESEGLLFGGCLSLTAALIGTPYDFWIDDGIWFFEEVDEAIYRVDRMLTHLRLSGRMQRVRGVIIGKLKGCGGEAEMIELLRDFFGPLGIPVVHDLPFGHYGDNLVMPIGTSVRLDTRAMTLTIAEASVAR